MAEYESIDFPSIGMKNHQWQVGADVPSVENGFSLMLGSKNDRMAFGARAGLWYIVRTTAINPVGQDNLLPGSGTEQCRLQSLWTVAWSDPYCSGRPCLKSCDPVEDVDQPALFYTDHTFGHIIEKLPDVYNCMGAHSALYWNGGNVIHYLDKGLPFRTLRNIPKMIHKPKSVIRVIFS